MPELPRRRQLADAAITVLARTGMRGLTHRAVDAEAALPAGSTSNHFRTRRALTIGVVDRLAERDLDDLALTDTRPGAAADLMSMWTHTDPDRFRARVEITVEATRDPEIARILAEGRARIIDFVEQARQGAPPETHGALALTSSQLVALLAGLQWAEYTTGEELIAPVLGRLA